MTKKLLKRYTKLLKNKYIFHGSIFFFFSIVVFFFYRDLFFSYFESDEWFHFTYYLPLTKEPLGLLTAIKSTFIDSGPLSGGQHVIPIASAIFFLNTYFFGLNFAPYAFMSLLVHTVNCCLVFWLMRVLLQHKKELIKNTYAFFAGIFFALSPTPMHAVTGAAPFYGQNTLSVTFFLLCIILFKKAFALKEKKFIYLSIIFLFCALFTKETTAFLFLVLPIIVMLEKNIFSRKFLLKLFALTVVVYMIFRLVIPNVVSGKFIENITDDYISKGRIQNTNDTGTITSNDISIHKNLLGELLFRSLTFPVKMIGGLYLPRQTLTLVTDIITPLVYPSPPSREDLEKTQERIFFRTGPGGNFILFIFSILILFLFGSMIKKFYKEHNQEEFKTILTGLLITVLSSIPLVAIIFSFPRWGYDIYFDSRFYYNPNVGAAILFPFLLFAISKFISKLIRIRLIYVVVLIFFIWFINTINVFNAFLKLSVHDTGVPRREIIKQIKEYLPVLPSNAIFYVETDGMGPYGSVLPFQTSVPQVFTVAYYDKNPLPKSFFEKMLFDGKAQGYLFSEGRGFGYYSSRKALAEELLAGKFKIRDVYAFYFDSQKIKILDKTADIRKEMDDYLKIKNAEIKWQTYQDILRNITFRYPQGTYIEEVKDIESPIIIKTLNLSHPEFNAKLMILNFPAFIPEDYKKIKELIKNDIVNLNKIVYDTYHSNEALVIIENEKRIYIVKYLDKLVLLETTNNDSHAVQLIERITGSIE